MIDMIAHPKVWPGSGRTSVKGEPGDLESGVDALLAEGLEQERLPGSDCDRGVRRCRIIRRNTIVAQRSSLRKRSPWEPAGSDGAALADHPRLAVLQHAEEVTGNA
jgi:hypothetical protein